MLFLIYMSDYAVIIYVRLTKVKRVFFRNLLETMSIVNSQGAQAGGGLIPQPTANTLCYSIWANLMGGKTLYFSTEEGKHTLMH